MRFGFDILDILLVWTLVDLGGLEGIDTRLDYVLRIDEGISQGLIRCVLPVGTLDMEGRVELLVGKKRCVTVLFVRLGQSSR